MRLAADRIAQAELDARAPDAAGMQALQFGIADTGIDDTDAAGIAQLRDRVQGAAIVGAIGRRLHHYAAGGAQLFLQGAIIRHRGEGRLQHRRRHIGKARIVDVKMAVAGAVGHLERHARIGGKGGRDGHCKTDADKSAAVERCHKNSYF